MRRENAQCNNGRMFLFKVKISLVFCKIPCHHRCFFVLQTGTNIKGTFSRHNYVKKTLTRKQMFDLQQILNYRPFLPFPDTLIPGKGKIMNVCSRYLGFICTVHKSTIYQTFRCCHIIVLVKMVFYRLWRI